MTEPTEIIADNSRLGIIVKDVFRPSTKKPRIVHLSFGDPVEFERFEFVEPKAKAYKH